MVGAHDKSQPKIWKQVPGEEEVVNIDACKPQTVSLVLPVTHPYSATQTLVRTWSQRSMWFTGYINKENRDMAQTSISETSHVHLKSALSHSDNHFS